MSADVYDNFDLMIESKFMTRHCLGVASTGGGKTNFLNLMLKQQMMRGGGAIHIDGKNSKESILDFLNLARQHNRWHDVRIINIDDASLSNTYNPLLRGDADELTSRIMQLFGGAGEHGNTTRGVRAIAGILKAMNQPFNFGDMYVLMSEAGAMQWVLEEGPKDTQAYQDFKTFVGQIAKFEDNNLVLDEGRQQNILGKVASHLHMHSTSETGRVLGAYNPDIDLYQAMRENLLIYVALPMLAKSEMSIEFAKFFVSDLRTAIGQLQNDNYKPFPTYMVLMDEFSSYAMPSLAPLFEQARAANVCLFPFVQTLSSLKDSSNGLSEDFASKVIGNIWNKLAFVLQDPESCEMMSNIAGQSLQESISESFGDSVSFSEGDDDASMLRTGGRGKSYDKSVSKEYGAIVRPDEFRNLETGEAIYVGQQEVLKLQVPLVEFDNTDKNLDFPKFDLPSRRGLDIAQRFHRLAAMG